MLIVRPATLDDLDDFIGLARAAGPGFTSLAVSDEDLQKRLAKSDRSFALKSDERGDYVYLLILEDSDTGEVVGVSAVKAQVGVNKPFFSFKLLKVAQNSSVADRHFDMQVMLLVNEYSGASEVGTLFVKSKMRGTGAGRLISQARYMLIAAAPDRFAETVMSELRGQVDRNGYSPFWEALGRKFFKMDFDDADSFTAGSDNQFITDLMPKYPIYKELLSEEAQAVIGVCHPDGLGAKRLLEEEGFRFENCVDIFDAGPTVVAPRDQIRTVKDSRQFELTKEGVTTGKRALVSNDRVNDFRAVFSEVEISDGKINLSEDVQTALKVKPGDKVRAYVH
jgi:arginine N-succinyltransferase